MACVCVCMCVVQRGYEGTKIGKERFMQENKNIKYSEKRKYFLIFLIVLLICNMSCLHLKTYLLSHILMGFLWLGWQRISACSTRRWGFDPSRSEEDPTGEGKGWPLQCFSHGGIHGLPVSPWSPEVGHDFKLTFFHSTSHTRSAYFQFLILTCFFVAVEIGCQ